MKWKPASQLHVSLYRKRGSKDKAAKDRAFDSVRQQTSGLDAGRVRGVKVMLKELGGPWDESHLKALL